MAASRYNHNPGHHWDIGHSKQKLRTMAKEVRHHGEFQHFTESLFIGISKSHKEGSGYLRPWDMAWYPVVSPRNNIRSSDNLNYNN